MARTSTMNADSTTRVVPSVTEGTPPMYPRLTARIMEIASDISQGGNPPSNARAEATRKSLDLNEMLPANQASVKQKPCPPNEARMVLPECDRFPGFLSQICRFSASFALRH